MPEARVKLAIVALRAHMGPAISSARSHHRLCAPRCVRSHHRSTYMTTHTEAGSGQSRRPTVCAAGGAVQHHRAGAP